MCLTPDLILSGPTPFVLTSYIIIHWKFVSHDYLHILPQSSEYFDLEAINPELKKNSGSIRNFGPDENCIKKFYIREFLEMHPESPNFDPERCLIDQKKFGLPDDWGRTSPDFQKRFTLALIQNIIHQGSNTICISSKPITVEYLSVICNLQLTFSSGIIFGLLHLTHFIIEPRRFIEWNKFFRYLDEG